MTIKSASVGFGSAWAKQGGKLADLSTLAESRTMTHDVLAVIRGKAMVMMFDCVCLPRDNEHRSMTAKYDAFAHAWAEEGGTLDDLNTLGDNEAMIRDVLAVIRGKARVFMAVYVPYIDWDGERWDWSSRYFSAVLVGR